MGVTYSSHWFAVILVSWNEMDVWPHYGLTCTESNVHANIETCYLAFFDLFVAIVIGHPIRSTDKVSVVLLWNEKFVSWYARILVIENKSEIGFHYGCVIAHPDRLVNIINWFVRLLVDRFFGWHLFL